MGIDLAGTGVDHVAGTALAGVGELAVHEVLQRAVCHREPSIRRRVFTGVMSRFSAASMTSFAETHYLHK
jgi:hypothetical protein